MVVFGQIVIGPPGAGKTTYCYGVQQFTEQIERKTIVINLDFANDQLPYLPTIDVRNLITLQDAMETQQLGPNGGLIYCMETLLNRIEWLEEEIQHHLELNDGEGYLLIDCPGQIELYTHHTTVLDIINRLAKNFDIRLCSVNLLDSFYCTQPAVFISACLLAINTMLRLGLPHINVLSKVDLIGQYGKLPFSLDFYTELLDLTPILRYLDRGVSEQDDDSQGEEDDEDTEKNKVDTSQRSKLYQKFQAMTAALCEVVNDCGLVSFLPLSVEDIPTVARVVAATDKANGYAMAESYRQYYEEKEAEEQYHSGEKDLATATTTTKKSTPKALFHYASEQLESLHEISLEIQEKYTSSGSNRNRLNQP